MPLAVEKTWAKDGLDAMIEDRSGALKALRSALLSRYREWFRTPVIEFVYDPSQPKQTVVFPEEFARQVAAIYHPEQHEHGQD